MGRVGVTAAARGAAAGAALSDAAGGDVPEIGEFGCQLAVTTLVAGQSLLGRLCHRASVWRVEVILQPFCLTVLLLSGEDGMAMKKSRSDETSCAITTLTGFRAGLHQCWTSWPDAAFELTDTVLCMPSPVASVPALSLEPAFRRSHGSLYKALARGEVDDEAMRDLLVEHRPSGWPLVFAVDASTWPRCDAETSPHPGKDERN